MVRRVQPRGVVIAASADAAAAGHHEVLAQAAASASALLPSSAGVKPRKRLAQRWVQAAVGGGALAGSRCAGAPQRCLHAGRHRGRRWQGSGVATGRGRRLLGVGGRRARGRAGFLCCHCGRRRQAEWPHAAVAVVGGSGHGQGGRCCGGAAPSCQQGRGERRVRVRVEGVSSGEQQRRTVEAALRRVAVALRRALYGRLRLQQPCLLVHSGQPRLAEASLQREHSNLADPHLVGRPVCAASADGAGRLLGQLAGLRQRPAAKGGSLCCRGQATREVAERDTFK